MTTITENQQNSDEEHNLLSSEEWAILSQIAAKEPPHSLRAQALLAIDDGVTQPEAGRQVGLTNGQVRYWLAKFRKDRTAIFPKKLLNQAQQDLVDPARTSPETITSPDMPELEQGAGDEEAQQKMEETTEQQEGAPVAKKKAKKKSKKNTKKTKKSKKTKETKRDKKDKKGKKSTKKSKKKQSKKAKRSKGKSSKKSKKKGTK